MKKRLTRNKKSSNIITRLFRNFVSNNTTTTRKQEGVISMRRSTSIQDRVEAALEAGEALTAAAIKNRFGAANPGAVIQSLRFKGFPVFLNTNKRTGAKVYRTGKAPRKVIGAGYQAIAKGLINVE
jgi:hypothetical protein